MVFVISSQNENHKVLRKTVIRDGTTEELARNYYLTKYIAHGLPRSEN